jgi:hypothetical protein
MKFTVRENGLHEVVLDSFKAAAGTITIELKSR